MDLNNKSSQEIDELLDTFHKERQAAETSLQTLEQEDLRLSKQITELQLKRKNIAPGMSQGKYNLKRIIQEQKTLERAKWAALKRERGY